jgi:hypothetical protein
VHTHPMHAPARRPPTRAVVRHAPARRRTPVVPKAVARRVSRPASVPVREASTTTKQQTNGTKPTTQSTHTTHATVQSPPPPRKPATISDDFSGTQIDPTIWYQIATGTGWALTQKNGYVEYAFDADAVPGGAYTQIGGHLGSQCKFPGDFDARVDFALPTWPSRSGVVVNLWAFLANAGYAVWRQSSVQWGELVGSYTGPGDSGGVQLNDASGSLRLARKDGVLSAYFLHKGSWDELTSSRASGVVTVAIGANAGSDFGKQAVVVDLSNFTVTGDDPVCPPGSHPNG